MSRWWEGSREEQPCQSSFSELQESAERRRWGVQWSSHADSRRGGEKYRLLSVMEEYYRDRRRQLERLSRARQIVLFSGRETSREKFLSSRIGAQVGVLSCGCRAQNRIVGILNPVWRWDYWDCWDSRPHQQQPLCFCWSRNCRNLQSVAASVTSRRGRYMRPLRGRALRRFHWPSMHFKLLGICCWAHPEHKFGCPHIKRRWQRH